MPRVGSAILTLVCLLGATGCGYLDFSDMRAGESDSLLDVFALPSPGESARMAINPYNADDRYRGTLLLANSTFGGEPVYIELFEDATTDKVPNVRAAGVRGLANHGRPEHVETIIGLLEDDHEMVRLEAARALQRLHNPIAIAPLVERVTVDYDFGETGVIVLEPNAEVRAACADALGQYAEPRVLAALLTALTDPDLVVNTNAANSLSTLTGEDFGLDRRAWADWYRGSDRLFAGRTQYFYPAFSRDRFLIEYIPFLPQPPNEPSTRPIGMGPLDRPDEPRLGPAPDLTEREEPGGSG